MGQEQFEIHRIEDGEETIVLFLSEVDRGYLIIEHSEGSLTEAAYDRVEHKHQVLIPYDAVARCLKALKLQTQDFSEGMQIYFKAKNHYLVDLMDSLDRQHIPYGYSGNAGEVYSFRSPEIDSE